MTSGDDPFEEAARREHADWLRREAGIAAVRGSIGGPGGRGMLDRPLACRFAERIFGDPPLSAGADPAGLTARARPKTRPAMRARRTSQTCTKPRGRRSNGSVELRLSMPVWGVRELVVQILCSPVGLASQPSCVNAHNRNEAVNAQGQQGWHDDVGPPHDNLQNSPT